ncbi:UBP-type zinc finger domain-containing protein [Microbacterium sp. X-17]|uniref:UBP-type zinc finger domain-containing protein n=1 Tax=Microbacterium sp. X-17 TaxID=3144404 RepID=UPI0031F5583D
MERSEIDVTIPPSGAGCVECDALDGWWVHLRRCVECGHIGCCDDSPARHATGHFQETGHRFMRSFEPGETWFWDYVAEELFEGPELTPPSSHPDSQPTPGPEGRVPGDWRRELLRLRQG